MDLLSSSDYCTLCCNNSIYSNVERGENTPSIDVASKIAEALGDTLDYLVKDGEYQEVDKETLKRLNDIQKLSTEQKSHVFALLDAFIKQTKLQSIM